MALASSSLRDLRIYEPCCVGGYPSPEEESTCTSHLLRKIEAFYPKALRHHHTAGGGGLCLGLLGQVSNIVVNILSLTRSSATSTDDHKASTTQELARRSLDSMKAFLTRLFPDLREWQAMRYLFVTGTDQR
uniref:PIR2-like helical domain-containing protein n=1 Tax=Oryza punctata TaxID=4537 RepID=A0A0E0M8G1_ORYPU